MKTILIFILLSSFLAATDLTQYIATWDTNTEPDLAGYTVYIRNREPVHLMKKSNPEYEFEYPYWCDVYVFVKAFDSTGNVSEPSETATVFIPDTVKADFNNDGTVDIIDNMLINYNWTVFIGDKIYNPRYDIWPSIPDSIIDINDKLVFNFAWKKQHGGHNEN